MEAIKPKGNVMWAEFKRTDLCATDTFFFFFQFSQRRVEREELERKKIRPR